MKIRMTVTAITEEDATPEACDSWLKNGDIDIFEMLSSCDPDDITVTFEEVRERAGGKRK